MIEGLEQPDRIIVYSSLPSDQVKVYLTAFETDHPDIKVELVLDTASTLTERLIASEEY